MAMIIAEGRCDIATDRLQPNRQTLPDVKASILWLTAFSLTAMNIL
jgi:hypothetical protein